MTIRPHSADLPEGDKERLGVSLSPGKHIGLPHLLELARLAERLGYESIWVPETWGSDAVTLLTALALNTQRIKLASGVFNVFSRSAALLAQTAATLQELSGGRFILGLGTSGPGVIERWHGIAFERPLQRTREYIHILGLALSGNVVEGSVGGVQVSGFRLGNPPSPPVPIYVAALGPKNVRLTGELADGWLPIFAVRGHLQLLEQELSAGAASAGREPASIDVGAYLPAALGDQGQQLLRQQIAYYVGGMGTFYADFVRRLGFQSQAEEVHRLWQMGNRRAAVQAVDEKLLDACTLGSNALTARTRLTEYRRDGVKVPIVVPAHGSTAQQAADTLAALAPDGK